MVTGWFHGKTSCYGKIPISNFTAKYVFIIMNSICQWKKCPYQSFIVFQLYVNNNIGRLYSQRIYRIQPKLNAEQNSINVAMIPRVSINEYYYTKLISSGK
jgi:hypothetical protein